MRPIISRYLGLFTLQNALTTDRLRPGLQFAPLVQAPGTRPYSRVDWARPVGEKW